jgi:hypothetical protein
MRESIRPTPLNDKYFYYTEKGNVNNGFHRITLPFDFHKDRRVEMMQSKPSAKVSSGD